MTGRFLAWGFTLIMAILILLIVGTWVGVARAQPVPCFEGTQDLCEIRPSSIGHVAEVYFYNDEGETSRDTAPYGPKPPVVLRYGDLVVTLRIKVSTNETVYVEPSKHWASPPEAEVPDGDFVVIQIIEDIM